MIYCLEDDNGIRDLVTYTLTVSGFEAKGFSNSESFWSAMQLEIPELIILDIMLPDEDGLSVLKKIRNNTKYEKIPVIMATAKGTEYDKVVGLDSGADDYLAKPFGMMEMVSRVKAVLRRVAQDHQVLKLDGIVLNSIEHTVSVDKESVLLTLKEYELLKLFMENEGRVFTREQLLFTVWGDEFIGETRTVDVHIGTLRTKLGVYGNNVITVRGVGYKMEGKRDKKNI